MPAKLAFIGCGAMCTPMAERLIDAINASTGRNNATMDKSRLPS